MILATHGILARPTATASFSNTKSVDFDGIDDYVDCGDNDNLSFGDGSTDSPFSISAWVKIPTGSAGFYICSKQTENSPPARDEYALYISAVDSKMTFFVIDQDIANRRGRTTNAISIINQWFHVAVTYSGVGGSSAQNGIKLYVNGVRSDTTDSNKNSYTAMHNTTAPFRIGLYTESIISPSGNVDEVAIFNSELSSSDVTNIYNSGTPTDLTSLSPISWWRMGDGDTFPTLTDNGSGGNNGTMTNMVSGDIVADVPPNFNLYSLSFDGVDDFVDCGDNDNLSFGDGSTDSPFSISAWVNMHSSVGFRIVNKYGSDKEYYFSFNSGATASKLFFNLYDNSLGTAYIGQKSVSTYASLENQWIHIVGTYNGNGASSGIKLYINGAVILSHTNNFGSYVAMENTSESVTIGKVTTNYTDGLIDEVGIFNAELSSSDVTAIYNSGEPASLSSYSSLVSWWRFEEGSGTTATDSGSGGNNGTITNGATYSTDKP